MKPYPFRKLHILKYKPMNMLMNMTIFISIPNLNLIRMSKTAVIIKIQKKIKRDVSGASGSGTAVGISPFSISGVGDTIGIKFDPTDNEMNWAMRYMLTKMSNE
jgi:hypothetical protein